MKVIVCGAGQVGSVIARHLAAEGADVTVIDQSPEQARRADESYDVRGMVGHASHPEVLERAGAADADMLIAVTQSDEVNMVACQVGYSLFKVPRRIARIRHDGYLRPLSKALYANDQLPIDVIISPEREVANGIVRRLRTPGAFDTVPLADGRVQLLGIHCNTSECGLLGRPLADLKAMLGRPSPIVIAAIRQGKAFVPHGGDVIQRDDDLYLITTPDQVDRVLAFFGHREQVARRVVIVGGGNVGLNLAKRLLGGALPVSLKIVEHNRLRAELISRELGDEAVVLHGDALEREVLIEANIGAAETVIAVTNDDETNIFSSVLAKREGCERAITLVNKTSYEAILPALGLDSVVSPNSITISSILRHVRHRSVSALYSLREGFGEVIEARALDGSRLVSGTLREIGLPEGMLVGAIVRGGEVIIPTGEDRVSPGDSIIAMVTFGALHRVENFLAGHPSAADSR